MSARFIDLRSLRIRVLLTAAASIGFVLAVASVSLVLLFETHMQRRVAGELQVFWNELAGAVELQQTDRLAVVRPLADPRYETPLSGLYWQIETDDGTLLRSRSLWEGRVTVPPEASMDEAFEAPGMEPGSIYYMVSRPVNFEGSGGPITARMTVAIDHAIINALSKEYAADLTIALLAIAAALFLGALLQAQVGLYPLARLRAAIGDVRSGQAARMGAGYPTEIQPLAEDLDRMLDWRDDAVGKARDRAGALAHGFKTPLTILMLEARKLADLGHFASAGVVREQAEAMRRLVERELSRARVRGAGTRLRLPGSARVDANATIMSLVDLVQRMPRSEQLVFELHLEPGLGTFVDRDDLGEVVGNLLDNARKWAASRIAVRAERHGDRLAIAIIDDGPGFEADLSASPDPEGAGLGLLIVDDVLDAYGARLERRREDGRTVVSFDIPAATDRNASFEAAA